MTALIPFLAWPVSPEEGGGSPPLLMLLVLAVISVLCLWGSEQAWERWRVDVPGAVRHVAPTLLCIGLGLILRRYLSEDVATWLSLVLTIGGFFGLMLKRRRGG